MELEPDSQCSNICKQKDYGGSRRKTLDCFYELANTADRERRERVCQRPLFHIKCGPLKETLSSSLQEVQLRIILWGSADLQEPK